MATGAAVEGVRIIGMTVLPQARSVHYAGFQGFRYHMQTECTTEPMASSTVTVSVRRIGGRQFWNANSIHPISLVRGSEAGDRLCEGPSL